MSYSRRLRLLLLVLLVAVPPFCIAQKVSDVSAVNYVTDLAGVIDGGTQAKINAMAGDVERKTGAQIAVVTVKSLDGKSVEDYAVDLYKKLGIGHKDDRGVLLLVAPSERKYRIEVGYGLEPVINDARAGDIGRAMVPYLRQGDYDSAIALASGQLATLIARASNVTLDQAPPRVRNQGSRSGGDEFPWWILFPVAFFVIPVFIRAITGGGRSRRRGGFPWWLGPGGFGGGWGGGGFGSSGGGWGGSSGGGSFGGFGGGSSGGGGASGSW